MANTGSGGSAGFGISSPYFAYSALAAQAVSTIFSAAATRSVRRSQNAAAQAQANIARINADSMERRYQSTLASSESQILRQTMQAGNVKHSQRAALAANGIAVGTGSAAELQASTDITKELDSNTLRKNASAEAWGYRWQATNYLGQATAAEASKQNAGLEAASTLFGGASQIGFDYMKMAADGTFGADNKRKPATAETMWI